MGDDFMRLALVEANIAIREIGHGWYPGVGVVLVHQGRPIVRTHNGDVGQEHAEVTAIREARQKDLPLHECVLYANLEPCVNQTGTTHACTREIIQAGIPEVHVALVDPYHLVRGKGCKQLEDVGIKVVVGEYAEEARHQNKAYLSRFCPHCGWPWSDA